MAWLSANLGVILPIVAALGVVAWVLASGKKTEDQTAPAPTDKPSPVGNRLQADLVKARSLLDSLANQIKQRAANGEVDPIANAVQLLTVIHNALAQLKTPEAQAVLADLERMAGPLLLPLIRASSDTSGSPTP